MSKQKNILVCALGLTPQIVTESLYALSVQQQIIIDEIYILTTSRGKKVISGKDEAAFTPKTPLEKEIKNLCKTYNLKLPKFSNTPKHVITAKEEALDLPDIRDDNHNILFPNKAAEFIRQLTSTPSNILYCSISGGRKTMGVHLAAALSIFGREQDKLLHILTAEEFEFKGFYPVTKEEQNALTLAEIPFIKLRSLIISDDRRNKIYNMQFSEIVNYTQDQLELITDERKLVLSIETKELIFDGASQKLEPIEFALYHQLVNSKLESAQKLSIHTITSSDFAAKIVSFIESNYEYYYFREETKDPWWGRGFTAENFRSRRAKINKKIKSLIKDKKLKEQFEISSNRVYGDTSYFINANKNKFKILLG